MSSKIITDSESAKQDIVRLLAVPPDKVSVIYLGAASFLNGPPSPEDVRRLRQQYGIEPFFLYVGAIAPLKNLHRLVEAFRDLRKSTHSPIKLIVVGKPLSHYYRNQLTTLVESLHLSEVVVFANYVDNKLLRALYQDALALVCPSLAEGFGLPVLEAMTCGTPVISARVSSLLEVAGDAALYVDPYDVSTISYAMQQILTDPSLRDTLAHKGKERAALFSWVKAAQQTRAVYEEVYECQRR